jgi:hypothetical protein
MTSGSPQRSRQGWLRRLWRLSTSRFGIIVVAVVLATALVSLVWTPFDPQQVEISNRWAPPGWPHLLGTDGTGRDILSLLMAGSRTTVLVAVGAGLVATIVGIALAGLGGWWLLDGADSSSSYVAVLGWLGVINALLAVFNLLPGAPLDGGRIVKAVRWSIHGDRHRAAREAGRAGLVLGWMVAAGGFLLIMRDQSGIWLVITGAFIAVNAHVEIAAATIAGNLTGSTVRDLTWFGVAEAGEDMDADSMLWQRGRIGSAGAVAITDAAGAPQGLAFEDDMWAVPADERPWVMLTQMMVPFDRTAQASPDDDLSTILTKINPARPIVTVWEHGRLVGIVPPSRLRERLRAAGL